MKDMGLTDPNSIITDDLLSKTDKVRELEDSLIDYISYLQKEKEYSWSYIHGRLAAIFHFYTINRVNLNKEYVSKFQRQYKKERRNDSAYTREQIQQIISTCDIREKVVILILVSTGMRVGALYSLKLSDLKLVENQHIYKITVYEGEKEEYYTFCSFECSKTIDEYLEYRKRFGEILKPDAPLIREEFDRNFIDQVRKPRPLKCKSFQKLVDKIIVQAGIKSVIPKEEGQPFKKLLHQVKRSHGFRKFTITQMIKAKLDYGAREYLVGHRHSRGLDENYDRTTVEDRLAEYLKAVDLLTINEENRLRRQVQQLTIRTDDFEEIQNRMDRLDKMFGLK